MAQQGKLRVVLDDRVDALDVMKAEVYGASGFAPAVDFQEIERPGELVVEIRLADAGSYLPSDLLVMVGAGTTHLEVLSAWREETGASGRRPTECHVIDLMHCEIPDLALRAHRDGVPTACWYQASSTSSSHWLLAVPGFDADRKAVVGISRRTGYYHRFTASEAGSLAVTSVPL